MRISGSYMVKAEAMLHTSLRIQEEMMIANVTKNLSSEGKHVINIIHGTPSTAFGIETQTLTFLWEADTDDPLYKKAEERKAQREETQSKIQSCKAYIENLKKRITAAENAKESDAETVHKEEKVDYEKEYKKEKGGNISQGVWYLIFSISSFVFAIIFASEEISGFASFIFGCIGVLFLVIAVAFFVSAKDSNLEEFKNEQERIAKRKQEEKRMLLMDKANLSSLKTELESKEKELAELERQLNKLNV